MCNWFKRREQTDRYSTARFAIEAKSTVRRPSHLATAVNHDGHAGPTSDCIKVRNRWPALPFLIGKGFELLIAILLTSLGALFLQSCASEPYSPPWLRALFLPHCTIISANHVPFTVVGSSQNAVPFNYALKQCGAQIIPRLTGDPSISPNIFLQGSSFAIDGDVQSPQCWEFPGTSGQLGFSLTAMLNISWISIHYDNTEEVLSAPRSMIVWGLMEDSEVTAQSEIQSEVQRSLHQHLPPDVIRPFPESKSFVPLTMIEYNPHLASQQQFFSVFREVQNLGSPVGIVVLQILHNWGGDVTRLCQVGIHGMPVNM